MAIRFTIARRGLLPIEKLENGRTRNRKALEDGAEGSQKTLENGAEGSREALENGTADSQKAQEDGTVTLADAAREHMTDEKWLRSLRPRLEHRPTVDAVEFQGGASRLPSLMPKGELIAALDTLQRVMLHEMEKGNAVLLPGIGTFRLSLKGGIEVRESSDKKGAYYHGRNVRVDDILFSPDRELLQQVRRFPVDQSPYGQVFHMDDAEIDATLTELFATHDTVAHKDVSYAFELTLTRKRITSLLRRLVREGRLIALGSSAQTRYRPAPGHFGR